MRVAMRKTRRRGNTVPMERISLFSKAITVQITPELHSEVKKRAALRNIPLSRWVTRVIVGSLKKEREFE